MTPMDRFDYCHPLPRLFFFWQTLVATIQAQSGMQEQKSLVTSPDFDCKTLFKISVSEFPQEGFFFPEERENTNKTNKQ